MWFLFPCSEGSWYLKHFKIMLRTEHYISHPHSISMQAPLGMSLRQNLCHRIPIVCGDCNQKWTQSLLDDMEFVWNFWNFIAFPYQMLQYNKWYGNCMGLYKKCNIPISDASKRGWYGNYMELCQIHSIPIQKGQGSYGIGMGLIHIFPIPDTMGNLWNCAKYVAIP